ncbi:DUF2397 family protein [Nonomuraea angiospora]|uniref:Uncharacterized protein n=1 Tax=Nonomuraea angiospora TaxID=46172 RepID=A0ABR9M158_9ACTN|nr:DUF2397 family protein [Nonomuraea angiospora]MBE1586639.1 hypothetical protein [Nonomuraea angiospora]
MRRAIDFSDGDVAGFIAYKERLIDYINRFIADLANSGARIATLLGELEKGDHDRLLRLAARREAADAAGAGREAFQWLRHRQCQRDAHRHTHQTGDATTRLHRPLRAARQVRREPPRIPAQKHLAHQSHRYGRDCHHDAPSSGSGS